MDNQMMGGGAGKCGCMHHKMGGVFLVLFALVFLLGNLGVVTAQFVNIAWPIIVVGAGLTKLTSGKCQCCTAQ